MADVFGKWAADGEGTAAFVGGTGFSGRLIAGGTSTTQWVGKRKRVATATGAFSFLPLGGPAWDGVIRREPEILIQKALNDSPAATTFTDEVDSPLGANVQLDMQDGFGVLSGGTVQKKTMHYDGKINALSFDLVVADYLFMLNKRRPFASFTDTSATVVAQFLFDNYAPFGFTADFEADLPPVTVLFDGSQDYSGCMSQICALINAHYRVTRDRVVQLFLEDPTPGPIEINDSNMLLLRDEPVTVDSDISQLRNRVFVKGDAARLMTDVTLGGITYVGGQVGGRPGATSTVVVPFLLVGGRAIAPAAGDVVLITVVVGSAGRNPSCAIATPAGYTPLTQQNPSSVVSDVSLNVSFKRMGSTPDTSFTLPSTGHVDDAQTYSVQVFRDVHADVFDVAPVAASGTGTARPNPAAVTPVTRGAVIVICGGGASPLGADYDPPENFTVDFLTTAEQDTTASMVGSGYWPNWTSGTKDPASYGGGSNDPNDSWAAYTIVLRPVSAGLSTAPQTLEVDGVDIFSETGGQGIVNGDVFSYTGFQRTFIYPPPDASSFTPGALIAVADNTQCGRIKTRVRYQVVFVIDGKASQLGPLSNVANINQVGVTGGSMDIAIIPAGGQVPFGASQWLFGWADLLGGIVTNGTAFATSGCASPTQSVEFTNMATNSDPRVLSRVAWRRELIDETKYREAGRSPALDNFWTDVKADASLGPIIPPDGDGASDYNTTGSKSFIYGVPLGPAGTTARRIYRQEQYNYDVFNPTASDNWTEAELCMTIEDNTTVGEIGDMIEDTKPTRVFSWSEEVEEGNPLPPPPPPPPPKLRLILVGVTGLDYPHQEGDEVAIWIQRDDFDSQLSMAEIEGGDGVHEFLVVDPKLRSNEALAQRGDAELELFAQPIITVKYSSFDPHEPGGTVVFNLSNPPIVGELKVMEVRIDKVHYQHGHVARYNVTASSVKFTLQDLLRRAVLRSF